MTKEDQPGNEKPPTEVSEGESSASRNGQSRPGAFRVDGPGHSSPRINPNLLSGSHHMQSPNNNNNVPSLRTSREEAMRDIVQLEGEVLTKVQRPTPAAAATTPGAVAVNPRQHISQLEAGISDKIQSIHSQPTSPGAPSNRQVPRSSREDALRDMAQLEGQVLTKIQRPAAATTPGAVAVSPRQNVSELEAGISEKIRSVRSQPTNIGLPFAGSSREEAMRDIIQLEGQVLTKVQRPTPATNPGAVAVSPRQNVSELEAGIADKIQSIQSQPTGSGGPSFRASSREDAQRDIVQLESQVLSKNLAQGSMQYRASGPGSVAVPAVANQVASHNQSSIQQREESFRNMVELEQEVLTKSVSRRSLSSSESRAGAFEMEGTPMDGLSELEAGVSRNVSDASSPDGRHGAFAVEGIGEQPAERAETGMISAQAYTAEPVQESAPLDAVGVRVINEEKELEFHDNVCRRPFHRILFAVAVAVILIAVPVAIVTTRPDTGPPSATLVPTPAPTTAAPTFEGLSQLRDVFEPLSAPGVFDNHESVQYKALEWIGGEGAVDLEAPDFVQRYSLSPKFIQRYVLAVFFFSLMTARDYFCGPTPHDCPANKWTSATDECTWYAVTCNTEGLVTGLNFPAVDNSATSKLDRPDLVLDGILPGAELSLLPELSALEIDRHNIRGSINSFDLNKLGNLETLILTASIYATDNKISGSIPPKIGEYLPKLKMLDLRDNALGGSLPAFPRALQHLRLARNSDLAGDVPFDLATTDGLETFDLEKCGLEGDLPPDFFGTLQSIRILHFGGNNLKGSLNSGIGLMTEVQVIGLGDSSMEGELPPELFRLRNLRELDLRNANFGGELSEDFRLLNETIEEIRLNGNDFTGDVPDAFGYCEQLQILDLSGNPGLTGSVSPELCNLRTLDWDKEGLHVLEVPCSVTCVECCGFRDECN